MNKLSITFIIFNFLFLLSCGEDISKEQKLEQQFIKNIASIFKEKYNMSLGGFGSAGDDNSITWLKISFDLYKSLTKNEARKLIIECIDEYLNQINSYKGIASILSPYPFTYRNIEFQIIMFNDDKMTKIIDPDICNIVLFEGNIIYYTNDPINRYKFKSITKEPYEEALKIVQENP